MFTYIAKIFSNINYFSEETISIKEILVDKLLEEKCHQIYNKALSFNLVSSNQFSSSIKNRIQLYAMRASDNLSLSLEEKEIINHVFNWSLAKKDTEEDGNFILNRSVFIGSSIMKIQELINRLSSKSYQDVDQLENWVEKMVAKSLFWQAANCHEYSSIVYSMFMETSLVNEKPIPVEIILIDYISYNHTFVLVGRDQTEDLNRPGSWGKKARSVDPWAKKVGIINPQDYHRYAGYITCLKAGYVGQGHSAEWSKIFPAKSLLNYTLPPAPPENIPWEVEKKTAILSYAKDVFDRLIFHYKDIKSSLVLNQIKYILLNKEASDLLPLSMKIDYLYALVGTYGQLQEESRETIDQFNREDFNQFFEDPEIQKWLSGTLAANLIDKFISLKESFELLVLAYKNADIKICTKIIDKNESLKQFLNQNNFKLSSSLQLRTVVNKQLEILSTLIM